MTSKPSTDGLTFTRDCYGKPVRVFMWEGVPWFEAEAFCAAMDLSAAALEAFDRTATDTDIALYSFDDEPVFALSPIGAWKLVEANDPYRSAKFAAWAKREANHLAPDAPPTDPRMFLTLQADGMLPEMPGKYSGRRAEWYALKESPEHLEAKQRARSVLRRMSLQMANPQHNFPAPAAATPSL
jgi:hypothetical protein